ncbi:MAG: NAD-dependent epimerase/dehydratase family protein [Pseudomonadota bacterium]
MSVLVTGGGGFLGGTILRQLVAAGHAVKSLDLAYPVGVPDGVEIYEGSVTDPAAVAQPMEGVEGVIHAAAIAQLWTRDPADYQRVNVDGTQTVLDAAAKTGARMVLISSYTTLLAAGTPAETLLDESTQILPERLTGPYPASKRRAELAVSAATQQGQWACAVLPTAPIGAGDVLMTPPAVMLRDLATGALPALLDCRLNLVDAQAVAAAAISALDRGQPGARYLLSGQDVSISDLAGQVAAITGVPAPRARVPFFVAMGAARVEALLGRLLGRSPRAPITGVRLAGLRCRFDAGRAKTELGFTPRPLAEILPEALADMAARGVIPPQG